MTGKRQGGVLAVNGAAGRKLGKQRQQLFVFTVSAQNAPARLGERCQAVLLQRSACVG